MSLLTYCTAYCTVLPTILYCLLYMITPDCVAHALAYFIHQKCKILKSGTKPVRWTSSDVDYTCKCSGSGLNMDCLREQQQMNNMRLVASASDVGEVTAAIQFLTGYP